MGGTRARAPARKGARLKPWAERSQATDSGSSEEAAAPTGFPQFSSHLPGMVLSDVTGWRDRTSRPQCDDSGERVGEVRG